MHPLLLACLQPLFRQESLKCKKKKRSWDLIHALLGVSHSRQAQEIASFLFGRRRRWPIRSNKPLWSCLIVGLMQGPASKL